MILILLHIYPIFFTTFVHLSATVALGEQQLDEMKIFPHNCTTTIDPGRVLANCTMEYRQGSNSSDAKEVAGEYCWSTTYMKTEVFEGRSPFMDYMDPLLCYNCSGAAQIIFNNLYSTNVFSKCFIIFVWNEDEQHARPFNISYQDWSNEHEFKCKLSNKKANRVGITLDLYAWISKRLEPEKIIIELAPVKKSKNISRICFRPIREYPCMKFDCGFDQDQEEPWNRKDDGNTNSSLKFVPIQSEIQQDSCVTPICY